MKRAAGVFVVVVLMLLSVTVWPTRFRYDEPMIRGQKIMVRTDRFSGRVEYLGPYGWSTVSPVPGGGPAGYEDIIRQLDEAAKRK